MSLIHVIDLSFTYEGSYEPVFEHVSFQIDTNWKLGFIGRNGRGKTTFLHLLLGKYSYSGKIKAEVPFEYFPYEVADKDQETIEVMRQICPACMEWEMMREISLLDVADDVLYRPFCTLSNGEQTKVLLASLFLGNEKFLLIDEPTNHLDIEARRVVAEYLNRKKGFILVSHDRELLDHCVDHVLSINKTEIEIQKGNFSSWWQNKQRQDAYEQEENFRLKKEISRLSAAAQRTTGWSAQVEKSKFGGKNSGSSLDRGYIGHKSAKMMKRAKNIAQRQQAAIDEKSKLLHNMEECDSLQIRPLVYHRDRLFAASHLSLFYGEKCVFQDKTFEICRGDRVVLNGPNGSGKSSLLKLLCGEKMDYTGEIFRESGLKISSVAQDTALLKGSLPDYIRENELNESLFYAVLRKLGFEKSWLEQERNRSQVKGCGRRETHQSTSSNMANFSGGQKKKILLARSLCERAHLYVWDEPLNFIDIFSRMQMEELILQYQPTLMFVEHDAAFQKNIATKRVELGNFKGIDQ